MASVTLYFEVGSHYLTCQTPTPPKNNVGMVGLFWMNQHQLCVGGGEGEVDRKIICWQKCKESQDFEQDCSFVLAMSLVMFDSIVLYQQMYHRGAVIEKNAPSRPLACALLGEC